MNSSVREVLDSVPKPMVGGKMMALVTVTGAVGGRKRQVGKKLRVLLSFSFSSSLKESSLLCIQVPQVGPVVLSPSSGQRRLAICHALSTLPAMVSSHGLSALFRDLAVTDAKASGMFLLAAWALGPWSRCQMAIAKAT